MRPLDLMASDKEGRLYLTTEIRDALRTFLSFQEGVELQENYTHNMFTETLGFSSEDAETTLMLRVFNHEYIYIKLASFRNTRRGTMTHIFQLLCEKLQGTSIRTFVVESVLTPAMRSWCLKHGLHPSLNGDDPVNGLGINYACLLNNTKGE